MAEHICPQGHPMMILEQFRLAHDVADSVADTAKLLMLEALGVELGADVTLWYCAPCDYAYAEVHILYPEREDEDADRRESVRE
jgi:hypothetical protein